MQTLTPQEEGACVETEMSGEQPLPSCRTTNLNSPIVVTLLRCVQIIAALVGVFAIIMMIKSLMPTNHQSYLDASDNNQCDGEDNQPKSKSLQLGGRFRLVYCDKKLNGSHQRTLPSVAVACARKAYHLVNKVLNRLFCGVVHKSKSVTMPNEKS